MSLAPDTTEQLARARADLRMGVPLIIDDGTPNLVLAAETLAGKRLAAVLALGGQPVLAVTGRRAATLKARAYDGDVARIALPADATPAWVQSIADPSDDLRAPLKGPFQTLREGDASLHRAALQLIKSARLLPAALILRLEPEQSLPDAKSLTRLTLAEILPHLSQRSLLHLSLIHI